MNTKDDKTAFERRAKEQFDEDVNGMDARTRSRLTQARHAAVAEFNKQREPFMKRWMLPAAGLATVALVAVVFNLNPASERQSTSASLVAEDMDILSGPENIELLEDMEFYAWLESEPDLSEETPHAPGNAPTRS